jgi:hypothetical protein
MLFKEGIKYLWKLLASLLALDSTSTEVPVIAERPARAVAGKRGDGSAPTLSSSMCLRYVLVRNLLENASIREHLVLLSLVSKI